MNAESKEIQATEQPTIARYLATRQKQIKSALPRHLTVERLSRIAMTAINKQPKLLKADVGSLFGAIMECAQYGLEPGIRAHLVPFWSKQRNTFLVNYIPDYRGLIDLARRSGEIGPFYAFPVREHDEFSYGLGLDPFLEHTPAEGDRGEIKHFYAVAKAKDGTWSQFDVMTTTQVDAVRERSRAKDDGPWVTDYEAMGCKTVVRRLCKFLPASVELQAVVQADEAAERGAQDTTSWIEGEFEVEEPSLRDQVRRKSEGNGESPHSDSDETESEAGEDDDEENITTEGLLTRVKNAETLDDIEYCRTLNDRRDAAPQSKGSVTKAIQNKSAALTDVSVET